MSTKKNNKTISPEYLDQALKSHIGDYHARSIKLAYSGGLDSQVLLQLLAKLRRTQYFDLQAIHVHHGVSNSANDWVDACRLSCDALDIPLIVEKVSINKTSRGFEAEAREARYASLSTHIGSSNDVLLTAHHLDDQAETLMLHLIRGAGVKGMAAMPATRKIGDGQLCRPMLEIGRDQILQYAISNELHWIEDESNLDPNIRRSFLRTKIFPALKNHWPEVSATLARTAKHMAEADGLLNYLAEADLAGRLNPTNNSLFVDRLAELPIDRLRNALRYKIQNDQMKLPSTRQLNELVGQITDPSGTGQAEVRWGEYCARIFRNQLWLGIEPEVSTEDKDVIWNLDNQNQVYFGSNCLSVVESSGEGLAKKHIDSVVSIRHRQGGERCRLPGRAHHITLKNLLQQEGIPPWERKTLPLIYVGNQLAAIADRWVCEPFAANATEPSWLLKMSPIVRN